MKCARIALAAAFLLIVTSAFAEPITYLGTLTGSAEVPPTGSPGSGSVLVTFDLAAHILTVSATFANLVSNTTAAHIHCCTALPFSGNAGVATQTPSFALFPLGVTSGSFSQTLNTALASSYNPAFVSMFAGGVPAAEAAISTGLAAGTTYFNIHTTMFPGGEIRALLVAAVPEPSTIGLIGAGLVGIVILVRTRYMA